MVVVAGGEVALLEDEDTDSVRFRGQHAQTTNRRCTAAGGVETSVVLLVWAGRLGR